MPLGQVDHQVIREFVSWLYDRKFEKSSVARKLAALRTFFKYCVREGITAQNPAKLVSTPKLPKSVPRVLSAGEIGAFLDKIASGVPNLKNEIRKRKPTRKRYLDEQFMSEARPCHSRVALCFRVAGERTGRTRRRECGPRGTDAARAGQRTQRTGGAVRKRRRRQPSKPTGRCATRFWRGRRIEVDPEAVFVNGQGGRLTTASVRVLVKKYARALQYRLEFASAFAATCLRHPSASRWRRLAGDSGSARARFAFHDPAVHASDHRPAHVRV